MKRFLTRTLLLRVTAFGLTFVLSVTAFTAYKIYVNWQSVFVSAAFEGRSRTMKIMYAVGADVNAPGCETRYCLTPTVAAAWGGHTDILEFLLDHGADVNRTGRFGTTPLMMAAYFGNTETVHLLLTRGANPNIITDEGETALSFAKQKQRWKTIRLLEEAGAR